MLDRFGNKIIITWAPHEILWLEVAIMSGRPGLQQLYELSGRTISASRAMAGRLGISKRSMLARLQAERLARKAAQAIIHAKLPELPVPATRRLTSAELMTGRVSRIKSGNTTHDR